MNIIKFKGHNGKLRTWKANQYVYEAWQTYKIQSKIKGIPNYAQFCFFLAVIIEVARNRMSIIDRL